MTKIRKRLVVLDRLAREFEPGICSDSSTPTSPRCDAAQSIDGLD